MTTFTAFGHEFDYLAGLGERTVELPLALAVLRFWDERNTIEVGSVMPHNTHVLEGGKIHHRVVDLFDKQVESDVAIVENIDACELDYTGKNVLCLSTLEHFDLSDHGNEHTGGTKGPGCLEKIIREARQYFITLPIGYNKAMDNYLRKSRHTLHFFRQTSGPTNEDPTAKPVWEVKPKVDWSTKYASPFWYANGFVVLTNIPWMANDHTESHIAKALSVSDVKDLSGLKAGNSFDPMSIESQVGPCTRILLHELAHLQEPDGVYLEIGMRYGGSFCCALYGNKLKAAYGIDLPVPENTPGLKEQIIANVDAVIAKGNAQGRVSLEFEDCWQLDTKRILNPVTLYLFDGPHGDNDHCLALTHYAGALAKNCILVIDDWNVEVVKRGTILGLKRIGFDVMHWEERCGSRWMVDTYWNGIFIAHLRKQ